MTENNGHSTPLAALKPAGPTLDTLISEMPEMDRLFTALAAGSTPDFLDIMRALSEMVAFYTDSDLTAADSNVAGSEMSQKKCRFCS